MGLFKKTLGALNHNYDVADEIVIRLSPSIRRVNKLDAHGTPANGVITGIRFSLNGGTTRKEYAVAVPRGDDWDRIGVRTQPNEAHRLRLGVPVVVKVDGDRGILDWEAMREAWGLGGQFLAQESMRSAPDDGIVDTALDMRVQSHLKKWTPTEATIVSLRRRTVMGMETLNWDVELQLPDGGRTLSKGDEVPSYAQWYAVPGAVVPAVVNPKDTGAASINWAAFALAQFDQAGFDDDPPEGSVAAEVEATRGADSDVDDGRWHPIAGRRLCGRSGCARCDNAVMGRRLARRLYEAQGLRQGARRLAGGRDVHACPGRRRASGSGMSGEEMRIPIGAVVGEVYLHDGSPPWIAMELPGWTDQVEQYDTRDSYAVHVTTSSGRMTTRPGQRRSTSTSRRSSPSPW